VDTDGHSEDQVCRKFEGCQSQTVQHRCISESEYRDGDFEEINMCWLVSG